MDAETGKGHLDEVEFPGQATARRYDDRAGFGLVARWDETPGRQQKPQRARYGSRSVARERGAASLGGAGVEHWPVGLGPDHEPGLFLSPHGKVRSATQTTNCPTASRNGKAACIPTTWNRP